MDWTALGNNRYRILADGWWADVKIFFAEGSQEWCADVLATNSETPEYVIADIATDLICGTNYAQAFREERNSK